MALLAQRGSQEEQLKGAADRSRQMEATLKGNPFVGITEDGKVQKGIFKIKSTGVSTGSIQKAAEAFLDMVEITKTGPLEKLVWAPIKDPDNEIKTIHNRTEDPHPSGC